MSEGCGVCISADYGEAADVYNSQIRRAAKPHKCFECDKEIAVGEKHEYVSSLYEGEWSSWRTCLVCAEIRDAFYCDGSLSGQVWDDMREVVFPKMNTTCLARLQTVAAKQELMKRWQDWKGL